MWAAGAIALLLAGCTFEPLPAPGTNPGTNPDGAAPSGDGAPPPVDSVIPVCPSSYDIKLLGHSYRGLDSSSWFSARDACADDGWHLIKIDTIDENNAMQSELQARTPFVHVAAWIGLEDGDQDAVYRWFDNTPPTTFVNWAGAAPSALSDDCVNLDETDGKWRTNLCFELRLAACECDLP